MKLTARSRLETYASLSRTQSDEETYGLRMEPSVLASGDSVSAGGDGAGRTVVDDVEHATRQRRMAMTDDEYRRLMDEREIMRKELDRAWREVDFIAKERTEHLEWRTKLANDLDECERMCDVLARTVNTLKAKGDMLAAVVQGAKEEFVRVPYGSSHEDVAAINDWHRMADEALKGWE